MRVRVLSEWPGSSPCGTICNLPDEDAHARIATGWAEVVPAVVETHVDRRPVEVAAAVVEVVEVVPEKAVRPRGRPRGR